MRRHARSSALLPAVGLMVVFGGCATRDPGTQRITVTIDNYDVGQDPELQRQRRLEASLEQKIAELDEKMARLEELGDAFEQMLPDESAESIYIPDPAKLNEEPTEGES